MAQPRKPIELMPDNLDWVITLIRTYLVDETTRDKVGLARKNKGWEVWLEVDLIIYLLHPTQIPAGHGCWLREEYVYENKDLPIDIWGQFWDPFATTAREDWKPPRYVGIELKVEHSTNQKSLQARLQEDIEKCLDGRRELATQREFFATPETRLYCVGFTHSRSDVEQGWDGFFSRHPNEHVYFTTLPDNGISAHMEVVTPYYLVWWMRVY